MKAPRATGAAPASSSSPSSSARAPGHSSRTAGLAPSAPAEPTPVGDGPDPTAGLLQSFALPSQLRTRFEDSLGVDLGGVRLHTGEDSAAAAGAMGARAFATGNDIHFGAGQYQPDDPFGQHLIAHEVAHTVQQGGGGDAVQAKLATSTPGDAHEHEADAAADAMMIGAPARVSAGSSDPAIMRAPVDTSAEDWVKSLQLGDVAKGVNALLEGGGKLITIAQKQKQKGSKAFWFDDKNLLESAKNLLDTGNAITKLAKGLSEYLHFAQGMKGAASSAETYTKYGKQVAAAAMVAHDLIKKPSLDDFLAQPEDRARAKAWANQVGKTFDTLGDLVEVIPTDAFFPNFVGVYFKRLLKAPANYIAYFQAILDEYYGKVDAEAGTNVDHKAWTDEGYWEGPLTVFFAGAASVKPPGLGKLMLSNKESLGKATFAMGKARLLSLIESNAEPDAAVSWADFVRSKSGPAM